MAIQPFLKNEYGNPSSHYSIGFSANKAVENARHQIAFCLNAKNSEIYFTSCGSESDNWALQNAARIGRRSNKKHIITSKFEHHAILNTLKQLEADGFEITYLDVYNNGIVNLKDFQKSIRADTVLATIMFVNNEIGTIQPIKEIGAICKRNHILFHTDAVQAVGHIPIDVKKYNIDMLSFSGHKFNAMKGVGGLYCRSGVDLKPFINGGSQERHMRAGTENTVGIVSMGVALESCQKSMENDTKAELNIRDYIIDNLVDGNRITLNGDTELRSSTNVNLCFHGIDGELLRMMLNENGICVSAGSACASGDSTTSHVLRAIGLSEKDASSSIRVSIGRYNTIDDAKQFVDIIKTYIERTGK